MSSNTLLNRTRLIRPVAAASALLLAAMASGGAFAQNYPITEGQRATASQVAQAGVPLSELAPNAPDNYTIKRGDTLWAISKIFLKSPWRWPELWGMNMDEIKNPHRIYPGQILYLDKTGGRARLTTRQPNGDPSVVRLSPRVRTESLNDSAIPPVNMQAIEAFLAEPLIVDEKTFARAPRIVATPDNRVLLSQGDRAYARGQYGDANGLSESALTFEAHKSRVYRVFRNAVPLKDPITGEVLAYEAQYVGKAELARPEVTRKAAPAPEAKKPEGKDVYQPQFENTQSNVERQQLPSPAPAKGADQEIEAATIDIIKAKEEMRVGDRLLPDPEREFPSYVPHAPATAQNGAVVSVYGSAVRYAAQNQVVAINRGRVHGIENGHVLAIKKDAHALVDKTDDSRPTVHLPGEPNGLMMVFKTFDKVSYALVLDITEGVKVGDRFTNP